MLRRMHVHDALPKLQHIFVVRIIIQAIKGQGEVLTCSACAMFHLSNNWVKLNAEPQNASAS
ncbi:hypothetical protein QBX67_28185, partial [Bacillus sp. LS15-K4]|nr:hypothetical protein [Bacillus sp. LS15-K4]